MWSLEDETGEMNCLLTKRQGDDRDRFQEQIIEAGLMPDDVLGGLEPLVKMATSSTLTITFSNERKTPKHPHHGVRAFSDIHASKTFLKRRAQDGAMVHTDPRLTIKYLILSGDCVDGGNLSSQDKELAIPDLFGQYSEFAGY